MASNNPYFQRYVHPEIEDNPELYEKKYDPEKDALKNIIMVNSNDCSFMFSTMDNVSKEERKVFLGRYVHTKILPRDAPVYYKKKFVPPKTFDGKSEFFERWTQSKLKKGSVLKSKILKRKKGVGKEHSKFELDKLCDDVMIVVFGFLDLRTLIRKFTRVSHRFYEYCHSRAIWRRFVINTDVLAREHTLQKEFVEYPVTYFLEKYDSIEELDLTFAREDGIKRIGARHWKSLRKVVLNKYTQEKFKGILLKKNPKLKIVWIEDVFKEKKNVYLIVKFLGTGRKIPVEIPSLNIRVKEFIELLCVKIGYHPPYMKRVFFKNSWLNGKRRLIDYGLKSGDECYYFFRHYRG